MQHHNNTQIKTREDFFKKIYLSLYCKGSKRVTQGFTVKGSWRPNKHCNILTPTLMAISVVFLVLLMLNRRPRGSAFCWVLAFSTTSCHQRVSKTTGGPEGPFCWVVAFPNHFLSPTRLISNSLPSCLHRVI